MIVTRLKLANVRAVEDAEFEFKKGFNLIVGVNGVGKTTVLDALRICFSRVFPGLTPSKAKAMSFTPADIRLGFPFLNAVVHLEVGGHEFVFERREWRERVATDNEENLAKLRREIIETERLRDRPRKLLRELATSQSLVDSDFYLPSKPELQEAVAAGGSPLAVFYSTNRSVISAARLKTKSVGGPAAGHAEALLPRAWHIEEYTDWMRVQESLARESENAGRHVASMKSAASRFLPDCTDIKPGESAGSSLTISKAGLLLDVRQLSDGERGVLAIALDLARRLSQTNPEATDPLAEGAATVLIDEIDLHLHPQWQRQIVHNLTAVFPRCQFIATTHSPQVIGEVPRERVMLLSAGSVEAPSVAYGADSNWILDHVMDGASSETYKSRGLVREIEDAVAEGALDSARRRLEALRILVDGETGEIARLEASLSSLERLSYEPDGEHENRS
jgi:hypothetical protein